MKRYIAVGLFGIVIGFAAHKYLAHPIDTKACDIMNGQLERIIERTDRKLSACADEFESLEGQLDSCSKRCEEQGKPRSGK